ncbi:MAG TPA: anaerobic ribonucleoside-triphosphate reductase activating protein [Candidatus Gastranaerophilales bacterium]|nr:anaerobic ribonucleoside-triphosphate reductase activating protein [Candidatus Gastranaerophilales bacterium]
MIIGGFQKFSLLDYPGKISSIIFTQGCNFACSYCHNKELIRTKQYNNIVTPEEILSFLKERRKKIDAVVITGGEPTLQPDLISFIKQIKTLGFLVKLDTNGSNPDVLKEIIKTNCVDYIAMDIKAPFEKYFFVIKKEIDTEKIKKSMDLIKNSGIKHEFRTTVLKSLLSEEDIIQIKHLAGESKLSPQKYIPSKNLEWELGRQTNYSDEEFTKLFSLINN